MAALWLSGRHHRVGVAACGSAREQLFGQVIAVAFQKRGQPGQVNAQLFENLARVSSGLSFERTD